MKTYIKSAITAASLAVASTSAFADAAGTGYVGGLFSHYEYEETNVSEELNPTGFTVRGGYYFADHFAVEGRLGTGINDDSLSGLPVDLELDQLMGIYAVGNLPINDAFSLYGLLGFSYVEGTVSAPGISASSDDDGFSYGAGVQVKFTPQVAGQLEYVSYLDKSDYEITATSLGISYHF